MIYSNQYQALRNECRQLIADTLSKHSLEDALRGSWKHDDFHLDPTGTLTRSDLDLVVDGLSTTQRMHIQAILQADFNSSLALRVSVHGADSLLKMSLSDSFILNIGEFISKTKKLSVGDSDYDYTLAKIALLLLRSFPEERYAVVAARIGTSEARLALDVKLGLSSLLPTEKAVFLLRSGANPLLVEFVNECILTKPSTSFVESIRNRVRHCHTIDPWLQEYLIDKIDERKATRLCRHF
jgi:hypothetical protein